MFGFLQEEYKAGEVVEYLRKSRSDDPMLDVEEVLEKHERILREYAVANFKEEIPEENIYREVASSETIEGRPEFLKLLKRIESPKIKAVLVVEVQRLSRGDLEDAGRLIKLLRYTKTAVITPNMIFDLNNEYQREMFERELKRGNEYLEYFKKIQKRGKEASVKEGNYLGSVAPYGYERTTIQDGKKVCPTLKIKEDEANIVRMIFNWYVTENIGIINICNRLTDMGIKTKSGKKIWNQHAVRSILKNVHYIGCVRWNYRKEQFTIEDQNVKIKRKAAAVGDYYIFDGKHEAIIDRELFERTQEVMGTRAQVRSDTTLKNPFSGLVFCAHCGSSMRYKTSEKIKGGYVKSALFMCSKKRYCDSRCVPFNAVSEDIYEALFAHREKFKFKVTQEEGDQIDEYKALIESIERKLKAVEAKEIAAWERQIDPDESNRMPKHIFDKITEDLAKEKEELEESLCKAKDSIPQKIDYEEKIASLTDVLELLKNPDVSASTKNTYLKKIVARIEIRADKKIRLTDENRHLYQGKEGCKRINYVPPYHITIDLKA